MKTIEVPALSRVEGEGGLYIGVKDDQVVELRLDIYEPPRFFEGFLIDRYIQEVPDITARICGICPVAYQMSSVIALEKALDVEVSPEIYALRCLMYCGEYIESHSLHVFMLQTPDLFGQSSIFNLVDLIPEVVNDALRLKKIGNEILKVIGGRSIHPVNACVGGWYRWPENASLQALLPELEWGLETSKNQARWAMSLPYPELEVDYEFVAIHNSEEYGVMHGEAASSKGNKTTAADYEMRYHEEQVQHSNSLHGYTALGGTYLVGPLARLNLNHEQLNPEARKVIVELDLKLPLKNPYKSLISRTIELVHYFEEAIKLINAFRTSSPSRVSVDIKKGEGSGISEAPRGLLYHRYKVDERGRITFAKIIPPTAQNLPRIEADLHILTPTLVGMAHERATLAAEHLVRSYDPCISCATHFIRLEIDDVRKD